MREIKFRGKRLDNDQWVYGDLIQSKPNKVDGKHSSWIKEKTIMPFGAISTPTTKFIQVNPETVGQLTGLKDMDDNELYEGDILHLSYGIPPTAAYLQIAYKDACFKALCRNAHPTEVLLNEVELSDCYVIGNIYENEDLLKEKGL